MSARHSNRAGPALRALAEADPTLAALSLWCNHRDGARTRTAGETIQYGPDFEALPLHEQMGLAAHHILHVALRHSARLSQMQERLGPGFDPALFNLVTDALVNEAVLAGNHALPRPAVTLTELLDRALGRDVTAQQALSEWDAERLYFALAAQTGDGQGRERAAQVYAAQQAFDADLDPDSGGADADGKMETAARWRQHLSRALDAGRMAGRGIGCHLRQLADIPAPKVPWEQVLRRLLTQAVMQAPQITPQRPARRWIATVAQAGRAGTPQPGFEPGRKPVTDVARIAVAVDASSSVGDAQLVLFWAEVTGIARRMRAEIELMIFDDAIRYRARIAPETARVVLPDVPRGGGTAFAPVIAAASGAAALVILTDLEGDAGPPPRGLRVIWAVPRAGVPAPSFGRVIDLSH